MKPILGLVTILYNSDDVLDDFFKSISKQTFKNYALYIIDNSANEKTDLLLKQLLNQYPISSFEYIDAGGNIGVAAGNNIGIKKAQDDGCEKILILNNDIVICENDAFEKLLLISQYESMITPKVLYYDSKKIWMAGGYMDHNRALGVHFGMGKADRPEFNIPRHITYAPTCFLMVNASTFENVGYMDEKYFAYYDDTDFVMRAIKLGYSLWYEPSLTVLHKVSSSSGGDTSPFYIYYSNRNKIYFIRKNYTGVRKFALLGYTFLSRMLFYVKFKGIARKKLIEGLKNGFKISLH